MKKIFCLLIVICLAGCVKINDVVDLVLSKPNVTIAVGESINVTATVTGVTEYELLWISSAEEIATVDQDGNITGVSVGNTSVLVRLKDLNKSKYISVTVILGAEEEVSISLGDIAIELELGEKQTVVPIVRGISQYDLSWFSANPNIATVSSVGEIIGVALGSTTITVSVVGTAYYSSITVLVVPVESNITITFPYVGYNMEIDSEIIATLNVLGVLEYTLVWASSNTDIATVTQEGLVKAIAEGVATITASIEEQSLSASFDVFVTLEGGGSEVSITFTQSVYSVLLNESISLVPSVTGLSEYSLTWASNDETIASVSQSGVIEGVRVGTTSIMVLVKNTSITTLITINVLEEDNNETPDVFVSFTEVSMNIDLGASFELEALVEGLSEYQLLWTSNNVEIVEVSSEGLINALGVGRAVVVVSVEGTTASAAIIVNVIGLYTHISFTKIGYNIEVGQEVLVEPEVIGLSEYSLVWSSNNAVVATVTNGLIKGLSEGIAIVSVNIDGTDNVAALVIKVLPAVEVQVSFVEHGLNLDIGETFTPTVEVFGLQEYQLLWESDNINIATVDEAGLITAVAKGIAVINVRVKGTAKIASLEITVYDSGAIVEDTIMFDRSRYDITVEETMTLLPLVFNLETYTLVWQSSNPGVATVDQTGFITGISEGEAIITVLVLGTEVSASIDISVALPIKIEITHTLVGCADNTMQLIAVVTPATFNQNVSWKSSNDEIASVTPDGLVLVYGSGSVTFTATSVEDSNIIKTITIAFIYVPEDGVIFNEIEIEV